MSSSDTENQVSLGFITVVDQDDLGCIGGYLILNSGGRPLEFHCTAPVRANRAQQILYGVSLKPFLYGELVGRALLERGSEVPLVLCTDQLEMLSLQSLTAMPVVYVGMHEPAGPPEASQLSSATVGGYQLLSQSNSLSASVIADLDRFTETIPLDEPFGRITDAIEEARRGARAA